MTSLSVAIMHVPGPRQIGLLLHRLNYPLAVVTDPGRTGIWPTARRAWLAHDVGATHHLVIQDDILPCRDFLAAAAVIAEAWPNRAVSFFGMAQAISEAANRGIPWVHCPTVSWGQALMLPVRMIRPWIAWADRVWNPRYDHDDARLAAYCLANRIPIWHTAPCLVEHDSGLSLIPGRGALMGRPRVAARFIGLDASAFDIDWRTDLYRTMPGHRMSEYAKYLIPGVAIGSNGIPAKA